MYIYICIRKSLHASHLNPETLDFASQILSPISPTDTQVGLTCVDIDLRAGGAAVPTWPFLACQACGKSLGLKVQGTRFILTFQSVGSKVLTGIQTGSISSMYPTVFNESHVIVIGPWFCGSP